MTDTERVEPHRRTSTHPGAPRAVALGALALLLTLAACGIDDPAPAPTSTPSTSTPDAASETPGAVSATMTADDVTLEVTVPTTGADDRVVQVAHDAEAATSTASLDPALAPELALASPGTFTVHPDGSATVRDGDTAVGGLSAPGRARFVAVDDTHLELHGPESTGDDETDDETDHEVTTTLGARAVDGTDWGDREGGRSLAVSPTGWARTAGQAGVDVAWAEITSAEPEADTPTMRDQLECHAIGAPDKPTWNLEPWRPDVGLLATMAARCNPTS